MVQSQPRQIVHKTISRKTPHNRAVEWLKVKALSSSPSTAKKKRLTIFKCKDTKELVSHAIADRN
jgi:hypothetical protein